MKNFKKAPTLAAKDYKDVLCLLLLAPVVEGLFHPKNVNKRCEQNRVKKVKPTKSQNGIGISFSITLGENSGN